MTTDGAEPDKRPRPRNTTPRRELWVYLFAALSYIVVGFFRKEIFAWWWFGAAWFVLIVWWLPIILAKVGAWSDLTDGIDREAEVADS